jgi:hypothetical protein
MYMSFTGANEPLLVKKVLKHSEQKKFVNLNGDENETVKGWTKVKIIGWTAGLTIVGRTTAVIIFRYFYRKKRDAKLAEGITPTEEVSAVIPEATATE